MFRVKYKRVVLKLSGESLPGDQGVLDKDAVRVMAQKIKQAVQLGTQMGVVIGGGNIFRARKAGGFSRITADSLGMLGTVLNALALSEVLRELKTDSRIQSSWEIKGVVELFSLARTEEYLQQGKVVIFCAGTGQPFFTTDTAAALRAVQVKAEILLKATKVDGVYDLDPLVHPQAKKYSTLTFGQAIKKRLGVMDTTAFSLCQENKLPVLVFNLNRRNCIRDAVLGKKIGTLVRPD